MVQRNSFFLVFFSEVFGGFQMGLMVKYLHN